MAFAIEKINDYFIVSFNWGLGNGSKTDVSHSNSCGVQKTVVCCLVIHLADPRALCFG